MSGHRSLPGELSAQQLGALAARASTGDEAAMAELIEASQARLFRFCIYLAGNSQLAQDLAQDSFVKALEHLRDLREPAAFQGWLFTCARNLYLNHTKSGERRESHVLDDIPESMLAFETPQYEQMLEVRRVLAELDAEERALLLLIDLEERSYAEVADILGVSEGAIRSRLHRARQAFLEKTKFFETKRGSGLSNK